ncbi:uncharacterized protein LOC105384472 isoform X2 [Plutella xylostella]|uniref:uncharacterized protein LOC105384472 isoform X2 n=1 Tax=Plutella xylostella TaxID=51655 RepID=UPI0020326D9F|nr:uncharacterized protein LOC105384472 isoform X2 [Plutella xylostella]
MKINNYYYGKLMSTLLCYQTACAGCKQGDRRTRARSTVDCSNAARADVNWILRDRVVGNKFPKKPDKPMCLFFYAHVGFRYDVVRGCVGELEDAITACESMKAHVRKNDRYNYARCNICRGDRCNNTNRVVTHYALLWVLFGMLCLCR